jgi:TRAP-type mannitol/chloroaromatic compound transport system substrate-binding protein
MQRRAFLKIAGLGATTFPIAAPAIAQTSPQLQWRLTSSFPKSLDVIYGTAEIFAKAVAELTDDRFRITVSPPGEIAPGLQALDAVASGTAEMCHTCSYYYVGKDPTFAFGTAIPFGLNSRMMDAWLFTNGGNELLNGFYAKHGVYGIPNGNTGAQMGGWFRKEIREPADLKGLKFRIGGFAGRVLSKVGVVPHQVAGSDIYAALEKGTLDATEWVGPYDDEKFSFQKVAPFYGYPAWWEGGVTFHNFVNLAKWNDLPKAYKAAVHAASQVGHNWMQAKYDAVNPPALKRLVADGAQLRPFSQSVLEACYTAAREVYAETTAASADFKAIHDVVMAFRRDQYLWWQVAEYTFDTFMIRARARP